MKVLSKEQARMAAVDHLAGKGLAAHADALVALGAPALAFRAQEGPAVQGQTRLGGQPDVGAGFDWPTRPQQSGFARLKGLMGGQRSKGTPGAALSFVAQVNFADMPEDMAAEMGLPDRGILYLFYDNDSQPWGFSPQDSAGFAVRYDPSPVGLTTAAPPTMAHAFEARAIRMEHAVSLPSGIPDTVQAVIGTADDLWDAYFDATMYEAQDAPGVAAATTRLGGLPYEKQDAMDTQCALVAGGMELGGNAYDRDRARAILKEPNDWRLLLQIESDHALGMLWGDMGALYLWIKDSDLRARRFDRCWVILQC